MGTGPGMPGCSYAIAADQTIFPLHLRKETNYQEPRYRSTASPDPSPGVYRRGLACETIAYIQHN